MARFKSFVILAAMRTGSNLLESALNSLPGVHCHGEAFNPVLIGYPQRGSLLGLTMAERDADPLALWARIRTAEGLNGCRYFHDHDPRPLAALLEDPSCAKIVLSRNALDSYVSLKIARVTGQWRLGDARGRLATRAEFDTQEFSEHFDALQSFHLQVQHALQRSGQTAFFLDYEDVQDLEVLNGLAAWLGIAARLDSLPADLKPQNPEPLAAKVSNFAALEAGVAQVDRFGLGRLPTFEPRRGPNVPGFVATRDAGLLFMPIRPAPDRAIRDWLGQLGPVEEGFTQKSLRQWKRRHPRHRSFTVLRHPLLRAHLAFATVLADPGLADLRTVLRKSYKLPLPEGPADYAAGLIAWLGWLRANLAGQTSVPVQALWASQSNMVQALARVSPPDLLAREDRMPEDLAYLAQSAGVSLAPPAPGEADPAPVPLAEIWQPGMEKAAREAYPRDFIQFGFGNWRG